MLWLSELAGKAMVEHSIEVAPLEACGLLGGPSPARVSGFWPVENTARSPVRFELDPAGMLAAEDTIEAGGLVVVGVMHSHPTTSPEPSATDVADAAVYDPGGALCHVIVSLLPDVSDRVCAFRLIDGRARMMSIAHSS